MHRYNPPGVPVPGSNYSQGVVHDNRGKRLMIAGQVGARVDGSVVPGLREQIEQSFANFMAVLAAAGMGPEHIVKITAYAVSSEALPFYRAARDAAFKGHAPASTYVQVSALASPDFLFEVDGEAVLET